MRPTRIWVHPDFKKKLRSQAAEEELSVVDLTEELSRISNSAVDGLPKIGKSNEKKKRHGFTFRL